MVIARLEKLLALGPESLNPPPDSVLGKFDRQTAVGKLSPTSGKKRTAILANPTKQALADYEKIMASCEQSLKKALAQLDKTTDALQTAKEEAEAHAQRPVFHVCVCVCVRTLTVGPG